MQKTLLTLGSALVLGLTASALAQDHAKTAQAAPAADEIPELFEIGKRVDPKIELVDIDGKKHKLADYLGKTVVVDFWSVNCPWSKKYEKVLMELHSTYTPKGVAFLAIDSNYTEVEAGAADPYAAIREYVKKQEVPYPILIDPENVVADRFQALTTPHVFVIDAKGFLRYNGGVDNDPEGKLEADAYEPWAANAIDAVMAGKEVTDARTKPKGCSIKRVNKAQN